MPVSGAERGKLWRADGEAHGSGSGDGGDGGDGVWGSLGICPMMEDWIYDIYDSLGSRVWGREPQCFTVFFGQG